MELAVDTTVSSARRRGDVAGEPFGGVQLPVVLERSPQGLPRVRNVLRLLLLRRKHAAVVGAHRAAVPHSDISEEYFFTISSSGVTLYDNGTAEFTALDQWQREYYLFNEILQIRTFKIYRIWKAFMVWMKFVKKEKFSSATKKLTSGLFQLDPVLSSSLRTVRNLSCTLLDGALPTPQHPCWPCDIRFLGVWCGSALA